MKKKNLFAVKIGNFVRWSEIIESWAQQVNEAMALFIHDIICKLIHKQSVTFLA